jgi:hypothetical protein
LWHDLTSQVALAMLAEPALLMFGTCAAAAALVCNFDTCFAAAKERAAMSSEKRWAPTCVVSPLRARFVFAQCRLGCGLWVVPSERSGWPLSAVAVFHAAVCLRLFVGRSRRCCAPSSISDSV